MLLINCKVNLILTWSGNCFISNAAANQAKIFGITDAKRYVPVVTLSTVDNGKHCNNQIQVLKKQLIEIDINQK